MPTMQAVALGGGSLVNSAICVRPPDSVFDRWATRFELERTDRAHLDPHFDAICGVPGHRAPTPDEVQGPRNLLFKTRATRWASSSEPIARNVRGCRGSGECFTGCRSRAKQSMDVSYVPAALRAGARVFTSSRCSRSGASGASGARASPGRSSRPSRTAPHSAHIRSDRREGGGPGRGLHGDAGAAAAQRRSRESLRAGRAQPTIPSRRGHRRRLPHADACRNSGRPRAISPSRSSTRASSSRRSGRRRRCLRCVSRGSAPTSRRASPRLPQDGRYGTPS